MSDPRVTISITTREGAVAIWNPDVKNNTGTFNWFRKKADGSLKKGRMPDRVKGFFRKRNKK